MGFTNAKNVGGIMGFTNAINIGGIIEAAEKLDKKIVKYSE